ncbi:MAG: hypothetical protein BGN88_08020 [Clostridiales bacterium 43-6]|nr:MAG: hypothetical protein BGN88_08020 [Clostridiales bacterium 43-6]
MEISSMAHGVYNLGFLGVNTSQEARRFIDWWASRLSLYCFDDIGNGIFTDQKWVDLAPCLFDAYILKHGGYDFAIWSLYQCKMKEENGHYFVNGDELRFIHFSGAGRLTERCMDDWLEPGAHPFRDLYAEYLKLHTLNDIDGISHSQWSYQNYLNGKQIRLRVRCIYRKHLESFQGNPFEKNNMYFMVRSACISGPISLLRKGWSKFMRSCSEDGFRASVRKVIQKVRKRILQ